MRRFCDVTTLTWAFYDSVLKKLSTIFEPLMTSSQIDVILRKEGRDVAMMVVINSKPIFPKKFW